jgi:hypothetical protein
LGILGAKIYSFAQDPQTQIFWVQIMAEIDIAVLKLTLQNHRSKIIISGLKNIQHDCIYTKQWKGTQFISEFRISYRFR